jgi:hypothetical protein
MLRSSGPMNLIGHSRRKIEPSFANRDFLRTRAAQIIKLLDESSNMNNSAADLYEQDAVLSANDQHQEERLSLHPGSEKLWN